jgi:CRP-like cAMP-binding protein
MGLCASTPTEPSTSADVTVEEDSMSEAKVIAMRKKMRSKGRRSSVSAESGADEDKDFVPPNIPKTDKERDHIKTILNKVFLFQGLHATEIETLIGAMSKVEVSAGESPIIQGDKGDFFYVVDSGEFDVFVKGTVDENDKPKSVFHYKTGGSFGELALMYNAPRAATVTATLDSILWSVDRKTFRKIVIQSRQERAKYYENFLKTVPVLEKLTDNERSQLADALSPVEFKEGEVVINQGDANSDDFKFYLVTEGEATATIKKDSKVAVVGKLKKNDYFGERALLDKESRAATITASKGVLKCAALDIVVFERLMGRKYISIYFMNL